MHGQSIMLSGSSMGAVVGSVEADVGSRGARRGAGRRGASDPRERAGVPVGGLFDHPGRSTRAPLPVMDPLSRSSTASGAVAAEESGVSARGTFDGYGEPRPAFGAWLLAQRDRGGLMGVLIEGARRDRAFPRYGDPDAVRAHLRALQADGDMFAAVDDAELDWLSY
jgi:hypothetical protein